MFITEFMKRAPLFSAALFCFGSFGWAMSRHFRKMGARPLRLRLTGAAGLVFALLNVGAIVFRPLLFPFSAFLVYAASAGLFWSAIVATREKGFAACFQGLISPNLVSTGPYRFIRHPFYTAYLLTWAAGFVATVWWPLALTALVEAGLYYTAAREEERDLLSSSFGKQYGEYVRRTGRFVPKLQLGSRPD